MHNKIVIRNVNDLTDIQQILSQTEHNQIPVNYYDESTKQLKTIGHISIENNQIALLLKSYHHGI
ncbi:DNA polymerase III alpha subunit [Staphylococcus gallinarum]|uniref:DNA polymerase III alpha subunit n=1 Tax=Staphylococcus gallinarum TaxID=1293 RepID=A0A380FJ85_STAGA|nr:DNA polymerase III alpha subunit [Staphylococcus gallinarum]